MKSPVKVRVDIEQDMQYAEAGLGKRYKVTKWVIDRKTGNTVGHGIYGTNYSLKEARAVKKSILDSYLR